MKRLLIATLALSTILTACADDKESVTLPNGEVIEVSDASGYLESWERRRATEAEKYNVDVEAYSKAFNTEDNPADIAMEVRDTAMENESDVDKAARELNEKIASAIDNVSLQTFEMSDVIVKVKSVERRKFALGTAVDVNYYVENTVKERRMVPLERTIIVTDQGEQVEYDRDISNLPEWDLVSDTKTEGTVSFYLKDTQPSELASVDVIVPGVEFKRSDDELFTVYFNK